MSMTSTPAIFVIRLGIKAVTAVVKVKTEKNFIFTDEEAANVSRQRTIGEDEEG